MGIPETHSRAFIFWSLIRDRGGRKTDLGGKTFLLHCYDVLAFHHSFSLKSLKMSFGCR